MARTVTFLLFGSLALFFLCSEVSAGVRQHIEPIVSTVYYLQDYCHPPEEDLEEKYRHRRSLDIDHDHDHDHDSSDYGLDFAEDLHKTVKYYANKGYRNVKKQIKRELEMRRKWKQVFLDPVSQPSVVVRLWRPDSVEQNQQHSKILDDAPGNQQIQCKILLRISSNLNDSNATSALNSLANSTIGAVVNFLKFNKKPWLNDYRLRIVTSDPNMTQYWLSGRKLNAASPQSQLPVAVDLVTHPQLQPEPLMKDDLSLLQKASQGGGKWLLIELETINQTLEDLEEGASSGTNVPSDGKDNTELVINLYTKSTRSVAVDGLTGDMNMQGTARSVNSSTLQCPVGTFDCAGDGLQCIPSGLRCNGEDNCGNRFDELFNCGTVNLYYIFGDHHADLDLESEGFWFAVRILVLLFLICLVLYMTSLLFRCCDRRNRAAYINSRSPLVYVRSAKAGPSGTEPLLPGSSAFGPTAGRALKAGNIRPTSPPPSYFGNQNDNQNAVVYETIHVNNNYGQPLGSTTVNTTVRPSRDNIDIGASAPPQFSDNYAPMYPNPNIDYPNYGGTKSR